MPLTDKQRTLLARDLQRAVVRVAPSWTDSGAHDPGVTLLQLLAFALDDLQHRHSALDPHGRRLARDIASRAATLAAALDAAGDDCGGDLARVDYFTGMVLGSDDFSAEQDYFRKRLNRLNRLLHGSGVVSGLEVTAAGVGSAASISIAAGFALDRAGNELCVDAPCTLALPATGTALLVLLAYRERPCRPVPAPVSSAGDTAAPLRPSRIAESFEATLASSATVDAVALARVQRVRNRWRLDAAFKPTRVRR